MTLGYAISAYPGAWDSTGRDQFMINNNGTIFQKDVGGISGAAAGQAPQANFDPDTTWVPTQ
jgi:hypothetical protein